MDDVSEEVTEATETDADTETEGLDEEEEETELAPKPVHVKLNPRQLLLKKAVNLATRQVGKALNTQIGKPVAIRGAVKLRTDSEVLNKATAIDTLLAKMDIGDLYGAFIAGFFTGQQLPFARKELKAKAA
jgi:hypothetical protein